MNYFERSIVERWVGTPYEHGREAPGIGVDCIHLVRAINRSIGRDFFIPCYPYDFQQSDPMVFERSLNANVERVTAIRPDSIEFGDIVLIRNRRNLIAHCGVVIDRARFLHVADDELGSVRVSLLSEFSALIQSIVRVI